MNSYGTVKRALNIFEQIKFLNDKEVAIIGGGIIGLLTAYLLLQGGYQVTVYAKIFPNPNILNNFGQDKQMLEEVVTSQVSGARMMYYLKAYSILSVQD